MMKRRYLLKDLSPDTRNKRYKLTPQPKMIEPVYQYKKRSKQNGFPCEISVNNDSLTQKGKLTELNRAADELKRLFSNSPGSSTQSKSQASKKSYKVKKKLNKSERLAFKTYSHEIKKNSERMGNISKLPTIQNQQNIESMQKFYMEFHLKSKQLLTQLKERLHHDN